MMEERVKYFLKSNSVEENIAGYYILTKLLTLNPNHEINHNQITFFVANDEEQYTLDELTDILI